VTDWLLDTNILAELRRSRPEPKVIRFIDARPLQRLFVSAVTFAEIRFGIERVADHVRRADLHDWLTHQVRPMFDGRILPISEDVMLKWRLMVEEGRQVGHTFPQPDLIIAATASVHGMTVVTRDTGGFSPARVSVFNPWLEDERTVR
jgi:predicted nucleic acid-binding protein